MSESKKGIQVGEKNPFFGKHHTEESRKLMSKRIKSAWDSMSEEDRKRIRDAQKGRTPWNVGQSPPEETRQKISKTLTGRKMPPEFGEKIRKALTGRKQTSEEIEARRQGLIGKRPSEEARRHMAEAQKRRFENPAERNHYSEMQKGKKGHPISPETREKIRTASLRQWEAVKAKGAKTRQEAAS
jgi:hypothetical protein